MKISTAIAFAAFLVGIASLSPAHAQGLPPNSNCYDPASLHDLTGSDFSTADYANLNLGAQGVTCNAPSSAGGASDRWDTRAFIGLAISFDGASMPSFGDMHVTGGIRRTNVNADGRVWGGEVHTSVKLQAFSDWQLRALGLYGGTDVMGNVGLGWDFNKSQTMLTAAAQIPYLRLMVDYYPMSDDFRSFVEFNSYTRIKGPAIGSAAGCAAGQKLGTELEIGQAVNALYPTQPLLNYSDASGTTTGGIMTGYFIPGALPPLAINGVANPATWMNDGTCYTGPFSLD